MQALLRDIADLPSADIYGRVRSIQGLLVEVAGPVRAMNIGARLSIAGGPSGDVAAEVIGFREGAALALPFGPLDGVRHGAHATIVQNEATVRPSRAWLGRVVNGLGEPIDGKGPLRQGAMPLRLRSAPPPAHGRKRVGAPLDLGVRALNTFLTTCRGQRMGIFAGSGVGKSVLMSMIARHTESDVSVIGLIGERGREVQEFIDDNLGEEGLGRSVVVVATSDEAPVMRRQAAYLTLTIAEYFRDQNLDVLCMMDSITRFAMAQREIGLSAGEPPTTKGYTPTVFAELPRLLERAGPGKTCGESGSITGLFTVLVEGDDHNEPIADAARSILDGHIVMDRAIAERGRYPAINVLRSISRTMPNATPPVFRPLLQRARALMSTYADMGELIRLGAYRPGSSASVDEAIHFQPALEAFLGQGMDEASSLEDAYLELARLLSFELPDSENDEGSKS